MREGPHDRARGRQRLLGLALVVAALGCGPGESPDLGGEPWPPTVEVPAVLGYGALAAEPDDLARLGHEAIAWSPDGLRAGLPVVLVLLDEQVLGGDVALLLPVEDEDAFRASLAAAPTITSLGDDRYQLDLSGEAELVKLAGVLTRMTSADSPLDVLAALGGPAGMSLAVRLEFEGDYALLVPSLEAALVSRRLLDELPGLSAPQDASLVLSVDVDRMKTIYQEEIAGLETKLRGVLLGARTAGLASLAASAMGGGGSNQDLGLPVSGQALWALLEMLGVDDVEAVQVRLEGFGSRVGSQALERLVGFLRDEVPDDEREATPYGPGLVSGSEVLRVRHAAGSPLVSLLETLGGAPAEEDVVCLAFDAERLPAAFAQWMRPLGELAKGEGPPCDRYLDELAGLLRPLAGRIVLHTASPPTLALSLRSGESLDVDGLASWLSTLGDAAGYKGGRLPVGDEGSVPDWQTVERDGMLVVLARDADPDQAVERVARALSLPVAADEPGLRLRAPGAWLDVSSTGGELTFDARVSLEAEAR